MVKTVLIVEDDLVSQKLLEKIVSSFGYNVLTADNGEEALSIFSENDISLILLDIMLPGIDGYEVAYNIRGNSNRNIPIYATTSLNSDYFRENRNAVLFDGYIGKPVDISKIKEILNDYSF